MRGLTLSCPSASYDSRMQIRCGRSDGAPCGFQHFKSCKGWWVLTEEAARCKLRRKEENYETR